MPLASGSILKKLIRIGADPATDCWLWLGVINPHGYGVKRLGGKDTMAARWVWTIFHGWLHPDLVMSPSCGNPACVSPFHLRAVDPKVVVRETHSGLLPGDVQDIRRALKNGTNQGLLAEQYDVDRSTISRIHTGAAWGKGRNRSKRVAIATTVQP